MSASPPVRVTPHHAHALGLVSHVNPLISGSQTPEVGHPLGREAHVAHLATEVTERGELEGSECRSTRLACLNTQVILILPPCHILKKGQTLLLEDALVAQLGNKRLHVILGLLALDLVLGEKGLDEHGRWHVRGETEAERRDSVLRAKDALADIMPMLGYKSDGYETADITKWHDVGYVKPPFLRFEMHHSLIGQIEKDTGFFSDPWRFACGVASSDGRGSTLFLPKEVEYVYLVTHAHKHAVNKAIGIRFLADIQVYLDAWEKSMDWDEVSSLLRDSGIQDFESEIRSLTTRLFNEEELTEAEQALIVRMVGAARLGPRQAPWRTG